MDTSQSAPLLKRGIRKLVILPVGSIEQHGPYLPIDTDLRIAWMLAQELEMSFSNSKIETLLLPPIPFSCSWEHKGQGTIALTVRTIANILHDIAQSLASWNIPMLLVLVNWHGGNDLLASLASEITATEGIPSAVIPAIAQVGKSWDESGITDAKDVHAGGVETSIIQAYWPEIVASSISKDAHCEPDIAPAKTQAVLQAVGSRLITREGIWGAPEQADPEKGRALVGVLIENMHSQVETLLELVNLHSNSIER